MVSLNAISDNFQEYSYRITSLPCEMGKRKSEASKKKTHKSDKAEWEAVSHSLQAIQ